MSIIANSNSTTHEIIREIRDSKTANISISIRKWREEHPHYFKTTQPRFAHSFSSINSRHF